jgi:two-component system, sensor histidine kinase and response regulator
MTTSSHGPPYGPDHRKLALVLDDDIALAETMSDIIRGELNWETHTSNEAAGALDFVRSRPPDLIVLDVIMPAISGLEFYDNLKADKATSSIPILFVSGAKDLSSLAIPHEIAFLHKPFDVDTFLSAIRTLLGNDESPGFWDQGSRAGAC